MSYEDAHVELTKLTGIGPKVADCICLMSLNHLQAIPVDTHVIQIAERYLPDLSKQKTMTAVKYKKIREKFIEIYGNKAGWAQTVLFCGELTRFKQKSTEEDEDLQRKKKKINR
jgi:N-glycosylase/DNA lyase